MLLASRLGGTWRQLTQSEHCGWGKVANASAHSTPPAEKWKYPEYPSLRAGEARLY